MTLPWLLTACLVGTLVITTAGVLRGERWIDILGSQALLVAIIAMIGAQILLPGPAATWVGAAALLIGTPCALRWQQRQHRTLDEVLARRALAGAGMGTSATDALARADAVERRLGKRRTVTRLLEAAAPAAALGLASWWTGLASLAAGAVAFGALALYRLRSLSGGRG